MQLFSIITVLSLATATSAKTTPGQCDPTKTVITKTLTSDTTYLTTITAKAAHSCYTEAITQFSSNIRCSAFNTATCHPLECFPAETQSVPCKDKCCPTTKTQTVQRGCQTDCEPAYPTVTVSCSKTLSETRGERRERGVSIGV